MPPVLDPSKSKVDGLAFLGLSLARKSEHGHPDSETHQEAFDLNEVLDRDYECILATNDDGWLVGGGEPGPPKSYKLAAKDSAHVEIMRIGTYRKDWGGVGQEDIIQAMTCGDILIPHIEVLPTAVVANPDKPPELEIRFDMEPQIPDFDDQLAPLPINWQLRFLHNQLFKKFVFPSRFCPGPFHSTILRKAEFRSEEHKAQYFAKCDAAISSWREKGPQALNTIERDVEGQPITKRDVEQQLTESGESAEQQPVIKTEEGSSEPCYSGIWLFTDRENITHFFAPNFLPPYNTPAKRKIIMDVLKEEWDENALSWKPCGEGSMTKKPAQTRAVETPKQDDLHLEEKKSGDSLAITLESGEKHPVEETNGESQTHPYFKTLDTLLKDVMSHAHLAANVCAGQFEKDESVHALEDK